MLLDRVAATVNEGVVLSSELDEQMLMISERLREQKMELPPQNVLRQQVLDRLVLQELQMQRADRAGIKVSDERLNNAMQDVAERNKIRLTDLPAALASQGIDYATFRENMRKELAMQMLQQRDVVQRINVSPREIEQYLERHKKMPSEANTYDISHILVAVPPAATPEQLDDATKKADDVYKNATGGEDFATSRGCVLQRHHRARRRRARLAQGLRAADVPRRSHRRHEDGRHHEADPHAVGLPHREAQRNAAATRRSSTTRCTRGTSSSSRTSCRTTRPCSRSS